MEELCFRDENLSDVKSISDITEVKFHKNILYQKKKKKAFTKKSHYIWGWNTSLSFLHFPHLFYIFNRLKLCIR